MGCEKCGYEAHDNKERYGKFLCRVCSHFSPDNKSDFMDYINEKVDESILNTFRKYSVSSGEKQKQGMIKKASKGNLMSRAPLGYTTKEKKLVPTENHSEIEDIFEEFLNENFSLRKLAEKHRLSVNGLKKILKNFTYIGKINFNNQIYQGEHQPIISTTLFNHVQNKIEKLGIK